jgi:hypothetical protein
MKRKNKIKSLESSQENPNNSREKQKFNRDFTYFNEEWNTKDEHKE